MTRGYNGFITYCVTERQSFSCNDGTTFYRHNGSPSLEGIFRRDWAIIQDAVFTKSATLIQCSVSNKKDARLQKPRSRSRGSSIYHHDPKGDVICPVSKTLGSAGLKVLIAECVYTFQGLQQVHH